MRNTLLNLTKTPTLAAHLAGEVIAPLWVSPSGRAFYPVAGGAPDDDPPKTDPPADPPKKDDPPKQFESITSQEQLDRVLSGRLAREREKYADYDQLKSAKAEYDKLLENSRTEQEKAIEAAKTEGRTEALSVANVRLVNAEARALAAAAGFRNPQIAVSSIDLSKVTVAEDGAVDAEAIKAKLTDLATAEPYLVDDGKTVKGPKPDRSQGGGGSGGGGDSSGVDRGRDLWEERRGKKKTA